MTGFEYRSIAKAAAATGVPSETIRALVKDGTLEGVNEGTEGRPFYLVHMPSLEKWAEQYRKQQAAREAARNGNGARAEPADGDELQRYAEALQLREELRAAIESIGQQMVDPARRMTMSTADYHEWARKANAARQHKQEQLGAAEAYIAMYEAAHPRLLQKAIEQLVDVQRKLIGCQEDRARFYQLLVEHGIDPE